MAVNEETGSDAGADGKDAGRASRSEGDGSMLRSPRGAVRWPMVALGGMMLVFSALVLPTVDGGVSSWDSHKIQVAVRMLVDNGVVMLSRPPGHPTTDFFLFGGMGWLLRKCGGAFNGTVFLTVQWLVALALGGVFFAWLRRSGVAAGAAVAAVFVLMFSPQFFDQTVNGEEILLGLALVWSALFVLAGGGSERPSGWRVAGAIGLFAWAIGCRAELVLCAVVLLPVYFLQRGVRDPKFWWLAAAGLALAVALVWLPVLRVIWRDGPRAGDVADIHGAPVLAVWGYKVMFRSFGFPLSLVLAAAGLLAAKRLAERRTGWAARDWTTLGALVTVAVFLALFLWQPGKPAYILVCLPLLLWVVAQLSPRWMGTMALLTAVGVFAGVDIFRGRDLGLPHRIDGSYLGAIKGKPSHRLDYIAALARTEVTQKSVIIGDAWSWIYEHHVARGTWRAQVVKLKQRGVGFAPKGDPLRVLLPREVTFTPEMLRGFHDEGYEIVMDRALWRTLYARYEAKTPATDRVTIRNIPVRLIDVAGED